MAKAVDHVKARKRLIKDTAHDYDMVCVHCGEGGSLMSLEFHKHFLDQRHYLGVRTDFPHELYCNFCGDYQYSAEFDGMVGRKRTRTLPRSPEYTRGAMMTSSSPKVPLTSHQSDQTLSNVSVSSPALSMNTKLGIVAFQEGQGGAYHGGSLIDANEEKRSVERYKAMLQRPVTGSTPRGITNMGATCFMSSVLQVMLHSKDVKSALQRIVPFDDIGLIHLKQSRCVKREIEESERRKAAEEMKYAIGGLESGAQSSLSSPQETNGDSPFVPGQEEKKENSGTVSYSHGSSSAHPSHSGGSAGTSGVHGVNGVAHTHMHGTAAGDNSVGTLPDARVTHGCIPCELRSLFLDSISLAKEGSSPATNRATISQNGEVSTSNSLNATAATTTSHQDSAVVVTTKKFKRQHPPLVPSKLLYSVWAFADHMAGYEQQDAHEFFIAFLDGIETHLKLYHPLASDSANIKINITSSNKGNNNGTPAYKVLTNIFSGRLESEVQCKECSCISSTVEPFLDISLSLDGEISQIKGKDSFHGLELETCLHDFTAPESLSTAIYCNKCQENRSSVKKLSILEPPQVLAVHLKRFDAVSQRKIHTKVSFPLDSLDIGPFMQSQKHTAKSPRSKEKGNPRAGVSSYSLTGVITHKGSLNSGHYISYVKGEMEGAGAGAATNTNNNKNHNNHNNNSCKVTQWLRCDDETITAVTAEEVRNTEGYILFYVSN